MSATFGKVKAMAKRVSNRVSGNRSADMKRSAEEALSSSQDDRAAPIWKDLQALKPELEEAKKEASLWNEKYKAANALLDDASEQLAVVAGELGDDLVGLLKALASAKVEGTPKRLGCSKPSWTRRWATTLLCASRCASGRGSATTWTKRTTTRPPRTRCGPRWSSRKWQGSRHSRSGGLRFA